MNDLDSAELGRRAEAMLEELAAISAEPDRLVRLFLSPEHRRAADLVAQWMREIGLEVFEDEIGNVRGRIGEPPYLILGSHIDTVIDAGRYDGPLGVVAPILAVDALRRLNALPEMGLELVAFGDEEGSRFRSTFASSSACAGIFDNALLAFADRDGITLAQAIETYGKAVSGIPAAAYARDEAAAYVEVHIEQGPVLEAENCPLGVVTAIVGQSRMRVVVLGEAGHAGTVPMPMRHDALAGSAEIVLAVERIAKTYSADNMVATVGRIEAAPGATNVIPGRVGFSIDLRSATDTTRKAAIEQVKQEAERIAASRKLEVVFEPFHETVTTLCAPHLQDLLASAIEDLGQRAIKLPSGAGHDAQVMARLCPAAMLFVRCRGGISHNPAEYANPADIGLATAALIRFIEHFAEIQR